MNVVWLVPDCYGFLLDELEALQSHCGRLTVLSGQPITPAMRERLPRCVLIHCPERNYWKACLRYPELRSVLKTHGWSRILRSGWHTRKIAGIYSQLLELAKSEAIDVVHSHFAHPGGGGGTLLSGIPTMMTLRGYDILTTDNYGSLWNPFYRKSLIEACRGDITVTVGSSSSRDAARKLLGPGAWVKLVDEAMTFDSFEPAGKLTRASLGLPEQAIVLLGVGNLIPLKNYGQLIRALPAVQAALSQRVCLVLCGDGPERKHLEQLADELNLTENVRFLGRIARGELTDLYHTGDILVHPSYSEGFGNIFLEAFYHRLLVVASPVGVAPDIIRTGENGFLSELGDQASLERALVNAITALPEMSAELDVNRDLVGRRFGMERRVQAYLDLYAEASESTHSQ